MPATESTMKFKADISNMKSAMQEAGRAIRLANSEFKAAVSGMDAWNKSSDGLTAKLKQLDTTLQAQKRQLAVLENEYKKVAKAEGEDSRAAQELQIKINNQNAAIKKTEKSIEDYNEELKKVDDAADDAADGIEDTGEAAEDAAEGYTVMKGALANLVAEGLKLAINALKDFAKSAYEAGSNFEAAMSNVKALSGASGADLDKLSEKARNLGKSTKYTATEVADAFGYMSLAGWDTKQMLDGIDGVLNLAASSGMELAAASDMVTDYLSAFNLEASQAGRMADMLAYAQAHSNTTATQLGEAYGNSAAALNTAGQSIETVTALLEAMANQGRKGSEAGTALNGIMSQITQKMEYGAITIGETTVAVQDQEGNFRDLVDILADVESATNGMGTAEKSAALGAVFNRTSLAGLNQVLNEGVDKVRGYRDELYNATGAAEDMASVMQDNLQGDLTTMDSALEGLGIAAFNYFNGPLRSVVQGITTIIGKITDILTPQKSMLDSFVGSVESSNANVRKLLDSANEVMSGAEGDVAKLESYRDVLLEVAGAAETNEYQRFAVSQIVGELSEDVPELAAAWDAETGSLNASTEAINSWIDAQEMSLKRTALLEAQKASWQALTEATINKAKADQAVKAAEKDIAESGKQVNTVWKDSYGFVEVYDGELQHLNKTKEDAIKSQTEANSLMDEAKDQYKFTTDAVKELADEWGVSVDELGSYDDAAGEAADQTEELGDAIDDIDAERLEELSDAAEDMQKSIESAMEGAVSAFDEFNAGSEVTAEELIKNLDSQIEGLSNWADNMEKLGAEAGNGMSQELYDYLAEMGPESANLVQTLVDSLDANDGSFEEISQKWGEALQLSDNAEMISSYTTAAKELADEMDKSGGDVGDRFAKGVESKKDVSGAAGKTIADESAKKADVEKNVMNKSGQAGGQEYANGVTSKRNEASSAGSTIASSAKSGAGSISAYSTGQEFGAGYVSGIRSKGQDAFDAGAYIGQRGNDGIRSKKGQESGSPSKLTFKTGREFTQGYINGIVSQNSTLQKSVQKMASGAVDTLAKATLAALDTTGALAADSFSESMSKKVEYAIARLTYENEERLTDFDKTISRIEKKRDKETSKLQKASNQKQKALQDKYDKAKKSEEKKRIKKQIDAEKEAVKKQIKSTEKEYQKLIDKQEKYKAAYQQASSSMITEFSSAMQEYQQAAEDLVESTIKGVTNKYDDLYDNLMDKQNGLINKMTEARELFTVSSAGVLRIEDLKKQTDEITAYADRLKKIKGKVSTELFDEITSYDMREGSAYLEQLLTMSDKELQAYNQAYTKKLQTAQKAAEGLYKDDFKTLSQNYKKDLEAAFSGLPAQLETLGEQSVKGFINGLKKNTDYMEKNVQTFVTAMIKEFKKDLKISSPSKVMFELGEYTGEGFGDGLMSMVGYLKDAAKEITGVIEEPMSGLKADINGELRSGAGTTINNYNLSQTNNSPRPLTALQTYQARRQQIDMIKAFTGV